VNSYVVLTPFHGEAFGEVRYPSFGHAIDGLSGKRREPGLRAHVDDPPAVLPDHCTTGGLAGEEGPLQIHRHPKGEILFHHIFGMVFRRDTGIIHEDVEASEFADRAVDRSKDLVEMRYIHLQWQHAPAKCFDLARESAVRIAIAQPQGDVGASMR